MREINNLYTFTFPSIPIFDPIPDIVSQGNYEFCFAIYYKVNLPF